MTGRNKFNILIAIFLWALTCGTPAHAFPLDTYTSTSVLAQGTVVKIAVKSDGLYCIPSSTLRSWGFSDPAKVRVYGYPASRIPDELSAQNYVDDLPCLQSVLTERGLVFYGAGPGKWEQGLNGSAYFVPNDFSDYSYYFIAADAGEEPTERPFPEIGTSAVSANPATDFLERAHHERDLVSPGEAGPLLVGEEFRYTNTRNFDFTLTDPVVGGEASLRCSFVSNMSSSGSVLNFTVNGEKLPTTTSDRIGITSSSVYIHGTEHITTHDFTLGSGSTLRVGINFAISGICNGAWLNSLTINYPRALRIPSSGSLLFYGRGGSYRLEGVAADTRIWDVTDPLNISAVAYDRNGTAATWELASQRTFVAWNPTSSLPSPIVVGKVSNQNLHAHESVGMVIVAPAAFTAQAERLAEMHRTSADSLSVRVVDPELIYNEFGSGSPDVGALRRYFKMLYDRGNQGLGQALGYAIFMARTTFDTRLLTSSAPTYPIIPAWMPSSNRASLSDNEGYSTDDVCAMLADGSGASLRFDKLDIAIGRIPATDLAEATQMVDKTIEYQRSAKKTSWKNRFLFLADDQDNGVHMTQTESMIKAFEQQPDNQRFVKKIYIDAYEKVGSAYPVAREQMYRALDEGVVWWNFVGHANPTSWTSENMLTYTDINAMYLRHWPFIYAATCNFLRLDASSISGAELMYKERYGGAIGVISAVRPVYISDNGLLSAAMGRAMARRHDDGSLLTPGEIYRHAKNDVNEKLGDLNRLRYIFLGDPALPLAMPSNMVAVDSIAGIDLSSDEQAVMPALARVPVKGRVTAPDGTLLSGFNGTVMIDIFDAEESVTSKGHGDKGKEVTFEQYGNRVYTGAAEVVNGRFSALIAMPAELTQNFRPATMSLYAYATDSPAEAIGLERNFYVYGTDEQAAPDAKAPQIEMMHLNHSTFRSGDTVNDSPMLIARISDDIGINVSTAGIGHQMIAILDNKTTYPDVANFYTPDPDGSPAGTINYPFENLRPGNHTLTLRVWDTSGNPATADLDFFVAENIAPKIYDVYTDANPASTQANFYLSHDQPDAMATVTIEIFNLVGKPVWTSVMTGRSDMFTTIPVTWDLSDFSGRRVGRGIYLYRASISTDGNTYSTATKRIAVTAQ